MSPSPEVDLSPPSFEDDEDEMLDSSSGGPPTPSGSFSSRSSMAVDSSSSSSSEHRLAHNHRATSPPLEGDEREFTQTASSVRERGLTRGNPDSATKEANAEAEMPDVVVEESPEVLHSRDAASLFGPKHDSLLDQNHIMVGSSPLVKTRDLHHLDTKTDQLQQQHPSATNSSVHTTEYLSSKLSSDVEMMFMSSWDMQSPEAIELHELDDLLGCF